MAGERGPVARVGPDRARSLCQSGIPDKNGIKNDRSATISGRRPLSLLRHVFTSSVTPDPTMRLHLTRLIILLTLAAALPLAGGACQSSASAKAAKQQEARKRVQQRRREAIARRE